MLLGWDSNSATSLNRVSLVVRWLAPLYRASMDEKGGEPGQSAKLSVYVADRLKTLSLKDRLKLQTSAAGTALDPVLKARGTGLLQTWKEESDKAGPASFARIGELRGQLAAEPAKTFAHALMNKDWDAAQELLTPEAARTRDIVGRLPVSSCIALKAPAKLLASLLEAHPEAAKIKDNFGDLPLHMALKIGLLQPPAEQLPTQVLTAYPEAAKVADKMGELPLNYAIARGASAELIGRLLDAYPAAAKEKSKRLGGHGYLPLQAALRAKSSADVVQRLLVPSPFLRVGDYLAILRYF